jgi:hypothetical protein
VGTVDVEDLLSALQHVQSLSVQDLFPGANASSTSTRKLVDEARIGVVGGSHGGFLAAHLCTRYSFISIFGCIYECIYIYMCIYRYPQLMKAAALRNPVIDIPSMLPATDIPGQYISIDCIYIVYWMWYKVYIHLYSSIYTSICIYIHICIYTLQTGATRCPCRRSACRSWMHWSVPSPRRLSSRPCAAALPARTWTSPSPLPPPSRPCARP